METQDILKIIQIDQEDAQNILFVGRPIYEHKDGKEKKLTITIHSKDALSFQTFVKIKKYFDDLLGIAFDLKVKSQTKCVGGDQVRKYINHFNKIHNQENSIYAQLIENKMFLNIPEDFNDQKYLEEMTKYLEDCGIDCATKRITKKIGNISFREDKDEVIEVKIPQDGEIIPFENLTTEMEKIIIIGEIYSIETINTKKGTIIMVLGLHDGNEAIQAKIFEGRHFTAEKLKSLKEGMRIKAYGNLENDSYAQSLCFIIQSFEEAEKLPGRKDECEIKRIELHAHTNKSEMDGVAECYNLLKTANDFGMPALAITDKNVVQAYPDAQAFLLGCKNPDFKVLYGVEFAYSRDLEPIVTNPDDRLLKDQTYTVFDLETSGLSNRYDKIIEFGAVKIRNGMEIDRLQTFINPEIPLNRFTTEFTGISQNDVNQGPTFKEFAGRLLAFIDNTILVAHNGYFDYGFLESEFKNIGIDFKMPMIDTLPMARALLPELTRFRLGNLARHFKIEYREDEAHRADYDAEVLGHVFNELLNIVKGDDITLEKIDTKQPEDIFKKNHAYHLTLLAKNQEGIKDIYDLVTLAHTKYLTSSMTEDDKKTKQMPEARIVLSEIINRRENVLIGSACQSSELFEIACNRSQKELEEIMDLYDYIEIQPPTCYSMALNETTSFNYERLIIVLKNIIETAKKLNKIVVATGDCHYIEPEDQLIWDIFIYANRIGGRRHPLYYQRKKALNCPDQHFYTTQEMLDAFGFLDEKTKNEIVITNTHKVADQIERLIPLFTDVHTPSIDGCEEILTKEVYKNAFEIYGNPLPEIVQQRLDREVKSVTSNGFSVQYYIAHLLVKQSLSNGYVVGSRGSVGSSLLATMAKITEVNPLVPHYVCPHCHHSEFFTDGSVKNGFDLPEKKCPVCGENMNRNGHNIPFETFLGFNGDKVPDIDLNFSGEYQNKAQLQIKEIFGADYCFAAGTIQTVEFKTALGYLRAYLEDRGLPLYNSEKLKYIASKCVGVKRSTGQHPAGIVVCPKENQMHDFSALQYPANDNSSPWMTTHFAIKDLHDTILKLDILGHVDPTAIKLLKESSGIDPTTVDCADPETLSLFTSPKALKIIDDGVPYLEATGAVGLPEFGTQTARGVLVETKPTTFADLVSISGLTHGTNVWATNAQVLIQNGTCTLKEVIACRDDIMTYLIDKGLPSFDSFKIMESVRKGKGLKPEWIELMNQNNVPQWYIDSCLKIQYMFPKAHAVAYCMMAVRIAWFKVHMPIHYYAVYFSIRCDAYEIETMIKGKDAIYRRMKELENHRIQMGKGTPIKEKQIYSTLEVAYEMYRRGYHFTNIDINRSLSNKFIVDPDDPTGIIPSFVSIDGLGNAVGVSIENARNDSPFLSKEDLMNRTGLTNTQLEFMTRLGVLDDLNDTNQISFQF